MTGKLVVVIWLGMNLLVNAATINTAQPFLGVTHHQVIEASDGSTLGGPFDLPRPLVIDIIEIDPTVAGVDFRMQPSNGADPGEVTRMTTRSLVNSFGAQIGVNGDFYSSAGQSGGQYFANVLHNGVSDGIAYSPSGFNGQSIFNVSSSNVARVLRTTAAGSYTTVEGVPLYNAIGGNQRLVTNGVETTNPNDAYTNVLNPHSALAVTYSGNVLLMTVDGRQNDYSEGMYTYEMADLLIDHFNARDALNIDGGGSTTLVFDDSNDGLQNARVINSPSDNASSQQAGTERLVANSFAVFATPNPNYVPLPAPPRPGAFPPQPLLNTLTIFDDFEGSKGRFASTVDYSGSSRHVADSSSSTLVGQFHQGGDESLRVDIENTGESPSRMQLRFLSGVGSPNNNLHDGNKAMGNQGYVGFFLRLEPGNDPLYASIMLDDGNLSQSGLERSDFIQVIDDGQWHLYQWNLADSGLWDNFSGGNGTIDGPNSFVDSIYFSSAPATSGGTNWSGSVWIDTVAYNPNGDLSSLIPTMTADFDNDGDIDAQDFLVWQRGGSHNQLSGSDLALWQTEYGSAPLGATTAVPEPGTLCLLGLALIISSCRHSVR